MSHAAQERDNKAQHDFRTEELDKKRRRLLAVLRAEPELTYLQLSQRFQVGVGLVRRWVQAQRKLSQENAP